MWVPSSCNVAAWLKFPLTANYILKEISIPKWVQTGFVSFTSPTLCPTNYFFSLCTVRFLKKSLHDLPPKSPALSCLLSVATSCCEPWFCFWSWPPCLLLLPALPSVGIMMALPPSPESITMPSPAPRPPCVSYSIFFSPNLEEGRWKKFFNWKLQDLCTIKQA